MPAVCSRCGTGGKWVWLWCMLTTDAVCAMSTMMTSMLLPFGKSPCTCEEWRWCCQLHNAVRTAIGRHPTLESGTSAFSMRNRRWIPCRYPWLIKLSPSGMTSLSRQWRIPRPQTACGAREEDRRTSCGTFLCTSEFVERVFRVEWEGTRLEQLYGVVCC